MKLNQKYLKFVKDEIENQLTTGVTIQRDLTPNGLYLTITIKQDNPSVELYGTPEMREELDEDSHRLRLDHPRPL